MVKLALPKHSRLSLAASHKAMSSQAVNFNRLHIFERNGGVQNLCSLWHRGEYHLTCARTKVLVKADLSQIFGRNSVQLMVEMAKKKTNG